eukprot:TRINITY_DN29862_c0_g1_i1.p1 TRINITY_DN29862_c0_g1~~TRINITY_DN29862_c0_g1_i1.p1  ORF type:complete len:649 (-),score=136.40 TRINITY_DN29862_c0_g1_i1:107-2053(-)
MASLEYQVVGRSFAPEPCNAEHPAPGVSRRRTGQRLPRSASHVVLGSKAASPELLSPKSRLQGIAEALVSPTHRAASVSTQRSPTLAKALLPSCTMSLEHLASVVHLPSNYERQSRAPKVPERPEPRRFECQVSPPEPPRQDTLLSASVALKSSGSDARGHAQLEVPSLEASDDWARVKNGGKPLLKRAYGRPSAREVLLQGGLLHVASAPLLSPSSPASPSSASGGLTRRVSKVQLGYPQSNISEAQVSRREVLKRARELQEQAPESPSAGRPKATKTNKKHVSWESDLACTTSAPDLSKTGYVQVSSSQSSEDGNPSQALKKSISMMECLYDLRRVGATAEETDMQANPQEEPDEAMLHSVLKELNDTYAMLEFAEDQLQNGQDLAATTGGKRHATAVISARTLAVVQRKRELLKDVEDRTASFEAAHARREELLPLLVADQIQPPPELAKIPKFIASYTHVGGSPADANKSNFKSFASSFKLPSQHQALRRLRQLADEAAEWWAEACLEEAGKGAGHAVLRRLFDVAVNTGVDEDHPKLLRAVKIINDRLAERVIQEAREMLEKDSFMAERSKPNPPPVGPAAGMADKIEERIQSAVKEGVPSHDHRLSDAQAICKTLRERDGERKRLNNRQKRLEAQGKSQAAS